MTMSHILAFFAKLPWCQTYAVPKEAFVMTVLRKHQTTLDELAKALEIMAHEPRFTHPLQALLQPWAFQDGKCALYRSKEEYRYTGGGEQQRPPDIHAALADYTPEQIHRENLQRYHEVAPRFQGQPEVLRMIAETLGILSEVQL